MIANVRNFLFILFVTNRQSFEIHKSSEFTEVISHSVVIGIAQLEFLKLYEFTEAVDYAWA